MTSHPKPPRRTPTCSVLDVEQTFHVGAARLAGKYRQWTFTRWHLDSGSERGGVGKGGGRERGPLYWLLAVAHACSISTVTCERAPL